MTRHESDQRSGSAENHHIVRAALGVFQWRLMALFATVSIWLAVGGCWHYCQQSQAIREERYSDLKAIAELKVGQIAGWRKERLSNAYALSQRPLFHSATEKFIANPQDTTGRDAIRKELHTILAAYDFQNIILTDKSGRVLLSLDPRLTDLDASGKRMAVETASTRKVVFGDFCRCSNCDEIHLDVAAPILDAQGRPIATIILRSDPEHYLYPLIQSWPTASETAETLLVRKDGEDVLFLNQLRHREDRALTLRIPLFSGDLPAFRAAMDQVGEFEGLDYRDVEVLADIRAVPDSPWFMVAKVDTSEILAEARHRGHIALSFVVLSILLTGGLAAFAYSHRQRSLYRDLYRAERQEREAQEEIRTTLYSIGDAVIATDAAARVTRMNPTAEHLTGWREADALGRPMEEVFRIINEYTRAEVESPVVRVMREGTIVGLANHTLLIARDGTERPIADSGAPIRNADGQIVGAVLVFRDQTQQREADRALHESRELYRTTLYSIGDGVIATDDQGRVRHMNAVAEHLTGWREADALGRPMKQVFHIINEDARAEVENPVVRVMREGVIVGLANHTLLIARDGAERPIADSGAPIRNAEGQIIGAVLVFRDQTAERTAEKSLRQSEDRYRSLFDQMTEGFALHEILCDEKGEPCDYRFLDVNPAFEQQTGLKQSDVIGRTLREILAEGASQWVEIYAPVALTGRPIRFENYSAALDRYYDVIAYCPAPRQFAVLFTDITQRRQADESRRQLEMQLLQIQKFEGLGVLAGGVAHDFNNILAGIRAYADLLEIDLADSPAVCERVAEIKKATRRASDLTRQILTYAGKGPIHAEPLDLSQLIGDMKNMLEVAVSKRASLEYDLAADLLVTQADASQIRQVVMNLVVNASEALGDNNGAISISAKMVRVNGDGPIDGVSGESLPPGPYVCLEVHDTGCGMDKATLDSIFDPFFSTKFTGRGLGLAMVHGIVRAHLGVIQVSSELGCGSTFRVFLPAGGTAAPPARREPARKVHPSGSGSVLVVDDEEMVCRGTKALFESAGFHVLTANDGCEALDVFQRHHEQIVCVFLDLTMPKMSGQEVFHKLRLIDPHVRVVLTSGYAAEAMMQRFAGEEVFAFVQKPDPIDEIIEQLLESLRQQQ